MQHSDPYYNSLVGYLFTPFQRTLDHSKRETLYDFQVLTVINLMACIMNSWQYCYTGTIRFRLILLFNNSIKATAKCNASTYLGLLQALVELPSIFQDTTIQSTTTVEYPGISVRVDFTQESRKITFRYSSRNRPKPVARAI